MTETKPPVGLRIFQYLFGHLLAASLDYDVTCTILAMTEVPWNEDHLPPNSLGGVFSFQHLFGLETKLTFQMCCVKTQFLTLQHWKQFDQNLIEEKPRKPTRANMQLESKTSF